MPNESKPFPELTGLHLLVDASATAQALELALHMIAKHEPGDSRMVSDEFVAMSAISAGNRDRNSMDVIWKALAAIRAIDLTKLREG